MTPRPGIEPVPHCAIPAGSIENEDRTRKRRPFSKTKTVLENEDPSRKRSVSVSHIGKKLR